MPVDNKLPLICIIGPTATGKTRLAVAVALAVEGEIISADSRQVYKGMDIGTGKDLHEYTVGNRSVPIHLVDIVNPGYHYNVFEYQHDFLSAYNKVVENKHYPILCGGSGMYIEAVLNDYLLLPVPENKALRESLASAPMSKLSDLLASYKPLHNVTDIKDRNRLIRAIEIQDHYLNNPTEKTALSLNPVIFYVHFQRDILRKRITERLHYRLNNGMLQEVKHLLDKGVLVEDLIYYGLEYKYISLYLTGKFNYDEMVERLKISIHQFAKRQETWFRRMQRKAWVFHYVDGTLEEKEKLNFIFNTLKEHCDFVKPPTPIFQ